MQPRMVWLWVKGATQHLRRKRGAAHAEQDDVAQAIVAHAIGERQKVIHLAKHALGDRQPAEAVCDLGSTRWRPQRRVLLPQALGHLLACRQCQLARHRRPQRRWYTGLDDEGAVAHSTIVVAATRDRFPVSPRALDTQRRPKDETSVARTRSVTIWQIRPRTIERESRLVASEPLYMERRLR